MTRQHRQHFGRFTTKNAPGMSASMVVNRPKWRGGLDA
jgi:hypothetical protein